MVLLSKNFQTFHSVIWVVWKEYLHVLQCGGEKLFLDKSLKQFTTISAFYGGLHLWAGLTGRRLNCAAELPKGAFTAPSPDLEILQS